MSDLGVVFRGQQGGFANQQPVHHMLNALGQQIVMDFRTKGILDGSGYQVKLGSISAPVTGDGPAITDTAAEISVDAGAGAIIMPLEAWVSRHAITGDVSGVQLNTVQVVSSSGTAFTPLPLRTGGTAAGLTTARAAATGAVTVTADAVTTTATLFNAHSAEGGTTTDTFITSPVVRYEPLFSPVLVGAASLYLQVAIMTYFAAINYLEYDADLLAR